MSKKQQQGNTGKSVETLAEYRIRTAGQDARWVQLQREVSEGEQYTKGLLANSKASNAEAERDIANMNRVILSEQKKAAAIERDNEQLDRDNEQLDRDIARDKEDITRDRQDMARMNELGAKMEDGTITEEEDAEFAELIAQSNAHKGGGGSNDDYHTPYSASTSPNASSGTKTGSGSGSDSKFSNSSSGSSDDEKPGSCHVPSKVVTTKVVSTAAVMGGSLQQQQQQHHSSAVMGSLAHQHHGQYGNVVGGHGHELSLLGNGNDDANHHQEGGGWCGWCPC